MTTSTFLPPSSNVEPGFTYDTGLKDRRCRWFTFKTSNIKRNGTPSGLPSRYVLAVCFSHLELNNLCHQKCKSDIMHCPIRGSSIMCVLEFWELVVMERDDERLLGTLINTPLIDVNNTVLYHHHHRHLCQTCKLIDSTHLCASPMRAQIYLHSYSPWSSGANSRCVVLPGFLAQGNCRCFYYTVRLI